MRSKLTIRWQCLVCHVRAYVPSDTPKIVCRCGYIQYGVTPGLGDYLAAALHRVGVTRARYVRLKRWLGLRPTCRCPQRQAALNTFGRRLLAYVRK
jgi:hypothetical protein